MQLPTDDRHNYSKDFLYNNLAILMGGRVAEELVLHDVTTGAGNDLERATDLARKMVCEWGMSEKLGPLTFGRKEEEIFLGREIATKRDFSEQVALEIDHEVRRLVTENYERAKRILTDNMTILRRSLRRCWRGKCWTRWRSIRFLFKVLHRKRCPPKNIRLSSQGA